MHVLQAALGLILFCALAWMLSENRRRVPWRMVVIGIVVQLVIGVVLLRFPLCRNAFFQLNRLVLALESATKEGTTFVFGYLGGGELPFTEKRPGMSYVFAARALPLILVMSALSSVLFHWGILPKIVKAFARVLEKTLRIGGAEGLGVAANIFVGMVESPLLIRPYLQRLTRSELFTVMTCGMATIAGTVMVLYASLLQTAVPDILGHILTASIISAPAAIVISKIMIPETGTLTPGELTDPEPAASAMDALIKGAGRGLELLLNIVAVLVVLLAVVHLVNLTLALLPDAAGAPLTLQRLLGWCLAPVAWCMGVPLRETVAAGQLMGVKTVLNELIGYVELSKIEPRLLSDRSRIIMTYAMCGFANPGSLGIMIGGMGAMAPERREEIVALGLRAVVAGTLATSMTGAIAGVLAG